MEKIHINDLEEPQHSEMMQELMKSLEGVHVSLEPNDIFEIAKERLDVEIDIDDGLMDRFKAVFDESHANGPVHNAGRYMFQQMTANAIVENSRMNWIRKQDPEIAKSKIKTPLIVTGLPRSGTTYLLQLLASEPKLVSLKRWEAQRSFPSKAMYLGEEEDTRQKEGSEILEAMEIMLPMRKYLFDVSSDETSEEIELMLNGCYGPLPSFFGDMPEHDNLIFNKSQIDAYRYLHKYIQTLSAIKKVRADQRWLLKTPHHMSGLVPLDEVFPDATVVFSHRDPASVFASLVTLMGYAVRQFYERSTKEQLIERVIRHLHGLLRGVVRDADRLEGRCVHVYFNELLEDYNTSVERIYQASGMPYDDAARARVKKQAEINKRGRHGGRLIYRLEQDYGITREFIRKEYAYYLDKFPVQLESTQQ